MQENKIIILKMNIEDLDYISNNLESFDEFWNENLLRSEFENENTTCVVAKSEDEIVGFASLWEPPFEIHVNNIVVRKDLRGQGIGTKIMDYLINISREKNKEELTLEVNENNTSAIKLYEKFGFQKVGSRKNYYDGIADAIIMTRKL